MRTCKYVLSTSAAAATIALALVATPARAQLQISSQDGKQSFRVGILGQVQAESLENPDKSHSDNLFIRRLRVLGGFQLDEKLSVFFDTDSPNLGKGTGANGSKNAGDIFIQDFVASYAFVPECILDGGMMLTESVYNHVQSAASLMPIDYGPFTFVESTPLEERVGRDYGVRARGYVADDHFEYRVSLYQGLRGKESHNPFRTAGRVVYWIRGAQKGLTYRGTSFGKTQSMEIGATYDRQGEYRSFGGDFFWDQPVAEGDGFTMQFDYSQVDGKEFLLSIPKQDNSLAEVGYYFHAVKLLPFVQYARQDFDDSTLADEDRAQLGLAYAPKDHNSNFKVGYTRIHQRGAEKRNQVVLQYQVYAF